MNQIDENGNTIARVGSFTRTDGTTADMKEFFLQRDTKDVQMIHSIEIPEDVMDMPELHPMGNTYSLRQAISRDESGKLKQLVQDFVNDTNIESRQAKLHDILFAWVGASDVKPASRGSTFDARKLAVLETVTGTSYRNSPTSTPTATEAPILERSYAVLAESIYTMLSLQTSLAEVFKKFNYSFDLESEKPIKLDIASVQAYLDEQLQADAVSGEKLLAEVTRVLRNRGLVSEAEFAGLREHFAKQSIKYQQIIDTAPLTTLTGTDANESMNGVVDRNNVMTAGAGNDTLNGRAINDTLYGDTGDDQLDGREGDDILVGGEGNECLYGGRGNDTYGFSRGDGVDDIYEQDGTDTIQFGAGISPDDVVLRLVNVHGSEVALEITINGSNDKIIVHEHGGLRYYNSPHTPKPHCQIEKLIFADGTAWDAAEIYRRAHDAAGTDRSDSWVALDDSSFLYHGLDGNDNINGGVADDWLYGDAGDDYLYGKKGRDTLAGGTENDYLSGGEDNDTYVFNRGDGVDMIYEEGGFDTVRFGDGILPSDVIFRAINTPNNGISLEMSIKGSADKLVVERQFGLYSYSRPDNPLPQHQIERVTFADGTVLDLAEIERRAYEVTGTDGQDNMSVSSTRAKVYHGEGGNDTLTGGCGDDRLYGGDGDDVLSGNEGSDLYAGGRGNDTMHDYKGDDTYIFNKGDGKDCISDREGINVLRFGAGISPEDVTVERSVKNDDYNLDLKIKDSEDVVTVSGYFGYYSNWSGSVHLKGRGMDKIEFADGTVWTQQTIYDKVHQLTGTDGKDSLSSYDEGAVVYRGLGGDDYLTGSKGNDQLYGDDGNDVLSGGEGDDVLVGGRGDDQMGSYKGDDTYVFNRGDGIDRIADYGGFDKLKFGEGIMPGDVILKRFMSNYDAHMELSFRDATDKIIVERHFGSGSYNGFSETDQYKIDEISFADGTVWTNNIVYDKMHNITGTDEKDNIFTYDSGDVVYRGLGGDDHLTGGKGNDQLYGDDGNDQLMSGEGSDVLTGGAGDDELSGGFGDDTYVFNRGDGVDRIYDDSGVDTVAFGADISPQDVTAKRLYVSSSGYGNEALELSINGTNDKVVVSSHFGSYGYLGFSSSPGGVIEQVIFNDGTVWTKEMLSEKARNVIGTNNSDDIRAHNNEPVTYRGLAGNDTLMGRGGDDALYGDDGDDMLIGEAGSDVLDGGAGNDRLHGGAGDDLYIFKTGDGSDAVYDSGGTDELSFGYTPTHVIFEQNGSGLRLRMAGTNDSVLVQSWGYSDFNKVEKISSQDGHVITNTQVESLIQAMAGFQKDTGMTWEQALAERPDQVRSILQEYWTAPTA